MRPKKVREEYQYTKLNDVEPGYEFNVFGILVEVIKDSVPTSTGSLHSIYHIYDDSLPPDKLFRMNCFARGDQVPKFCVGDILRFHRVKIETWIGGFDGRVFNAFDVVGFTKDHDPEFNFTSSAKNITLTDKAKERISELREISLLRRLFDSSEMIPTNGTDTSMNGAFTSTNEEPNISTRPSISQADIVTSSRKVFLNPAAGSSMKKDLVKNPFYDHNLKENETEAGPSRKRSSSELRSLNEEAESTVNIAKKQASSTEKRQEYQPSPLSKKRKYVEEVPSSIKNSEIGKLAPEAIVAQEETRGVLSRNINSLDSTVQSDDFSSSMLAGSSSCPGIICAEENCGQSPLLIESDSIEFQKPSCNYGAEIPAADDEGNIFLRNPNFMDFKVQENKVYIDVNSMTNFKWPCYSSKVRIIRVKPKLEGAPPPRIHIAFRLKLTLEDAWGKPLSVYVIRENAAKFLGCSQAQYQSSNECRVRTIELLSEALSTKSFFTICLTSVSTFTRKMIYVYNTDLSEALKNVN
ncbi:uncharacterized protein LOC117641390 isoform X2 [Thrips palmi]|uniref:Uncharacterized protein LOC117641390 isoform X2 n=1 Tax=Thrips palmi TaxID=161013 RepID=A0A6P8YKQ7_THRPL|nr:uncharacterized protein LOC117641390 isoform X2 [Thrips palmi]